VGRNINPTEAAVITIGKFTAGDSSNVIPEYAEMEGTVRAFSNPVRDQAKERIRQITEGIEKTFQLKCDLKIFKGYPSFRNDKEVSTFLLETSSDLFGTDKVHSLPPTTGAEDFAYYAQIRPSAIIKLGCGNEAEDLAHSVHSPFFDIDEEVLMVGVQLFSEVVKRYLS
jgi:amidohydrolase